MKYPVFNIAELEPGELHDETIPKGDFWVFAYGSLMWNPGFHYVDAAAGVLHGYHRRLCLWSVRYRGTPNQPGLVLGLDRGGSCRGYAYRVGQKQRDEVLCYLRDREMITGAYDPRQCQVTLEHGDRVTALTFVSKTDHPHFVPRLAVDETVQVVNSARGDRGCNREYVLNTVERLNQMDISNTELHTIAGKLDPSN